MRGTMRNMFANMKIRMLLFVVAICGLATAAPAKEIVRFLAAQYSTATEPYWKEVETAFEKENPDIDLQVEVSYWKGLHDKITTLIGAKQQPDLANIGTSWLKEYVHEGIAQAIDSDPRFTKMRGRFIENLLQNAVVNGKM